MMEKNSEIKKCISAQKKAIDNLNDDEIIETISEVADTIYEKNSRVGLSGIGKSGDVAKKISSTLNSIGVNSYFIHPVEALHGDIGIVDDQDTVLLISNSGETEEVVSLTKFLNIKGITTVSITKSRKSTLGKECDYIIENKVLEEGAEIDLVPMASMTSSMVIGDCLANALMEENNFDKKDFGKYHPGGTIGKKIYLKVEDIMFRDIAKTSPTDTVAEVSVDISSNGKGIAVIREDDEKVLGVITDGDVRRIVESGKNIHEIEAKKVMTKNPITVTPSFNATDALKKMEEKNITQMVVSTENNKFIGVITIHDILKEGLK